MKKYICLPLTLLVILSLSSCYAHSSELFSIGGIDIYLKPNEIKKGIPNDAHLTLLEITIGKHTLDEVQARLGKAETLFRKEHAPKAICYLSRQDNVWNTVVFEAGALGGWNTVSGFLFCDKNCEYDTREMCTESSALKNTVQTKSGIRLGMSFNELINIIGKPSKTLNNGVVYAYRGKRKMSKLELDNVASLWPEARENPFLDVTSCILAKFKHSRLTYFKAIKIESY